MGKDMKKRNDKSKNRGKLTALLCTVLLTSLCWGNIVFAMDYVQNLANGAIFPNLKWVVIIAVIWLILSNGIKRNYVAALVTLVVGGVVLFFVSNPTKLEEIGNLIGGTIFNG